MKLINSSISHSVVHWVRRSLLTVLGVKDLSEFGRSVQLLLRSFLPHSSDDNSLSFMPQFQVVFTIGVVIQTATERSVAQITIGFVHLHIPWQGVFNDLSVSLVAI